MDRDSRTDTGMLGSGAESPGPGRDTHQTDPNPAAATSADDPETTTAMSDDEPDRTRHGTHERGALGSSGCLVDEGVRRA